MIDERKMFQLAYNILTDKRNENRYGIGFGIHVVNTNETYSYWDMLDDIKEAYKRLPEPPKEG